MKEKTALWLVCGGIIGSFVAYELIADALHTKTLPEQIRMAVYQQQSCVPNIDDINPPFASDSTGTVYSLGCDHWVYFAFVKPEGEIKVVRSMPCPASAGPGCKR